jgi:protein-S-isoprenylcysteine O-methyltransferase Ste14
MPLVLRLAIFTALYPGTVTGLIPVLILIGTGNPAPHISGVGGLGLVFILAGVGVYGWCAWDFATRGLGTPAPYDPPRRLVTSGLYRFTRNPMYVGILTLLAGEAMLWRSLPIAIYALAIFVAFHLRVLRYEEPVLQRQFGCDFDEYVRSVPRWLLTIGMR